MNDPNKRIDCNLSSLMGLKAELLRKQQEVNKIKKSNTSDPFAAFVPKRSSHSSSRSHDKKSNDKKPNVVPPKSNAEKTESEKRADEDYEMLAKSKRVLEAKAKLYDRMKNSGGALNSDDTCLVRFNQKKQEDRPPVDSSSSESESDNDEPKRHSDASKYHLDGPKYHSDATKHVSDVPKYHSEAQTYHSDAEEDDDKWTEYTDCLGRTRKCLKEDLEFFIKKDRELSDAPRNRDERSEERETPWFVDNKGISSADLPLYNPTNDDDTMSMLSKSSKMEEMRVQWEQKEQENLNRDQIHYQDVLFDEARTHGVGYYGFSADAAERAKQQKILEQEREKTLAEQRKRDEVRLAKKKIVAERVFAAKNRQRARAGLPQLTREEFEAAEKKEEPKEEESKEDQKQKKREEKERKKKEKEAKEREEKRQRHLRPWDQGKDNAPTRRASTSDEDDDDKKWVYKPEKPEPMSQEKWNELKRTERNPDFAPPTANFAPPMTTGSFNRFTTKKPTADERNPDFAPPTNNFAQPTTEFAFPMTTESFNRFTTIKPKTLKRRNEKVHENMFSEPIRNELDGNDFPVDEEEKDDSSKRRRAEVAPPPTFEYYGPSSSSKPKKRTQNPDLTASIEAGLRFLREKADKSAPGTKQSWVANTTYEE